MMKPHPVSYTQTDLIYYFLRSGTLGFGGPPALVGAMHHDLVVKRKVFTSPMYKR